MDNHRRAAKVGHRKSRNGCQKCKLRRVKCDEVRPICSNCQRLNLECSWPAKSPPATTNTIPTNSTKTKNSVSTTSTRSTASASTASASTAAARPSSHSPTTTTTTHLSPLDPDYAIEAYPQSPSAEQLEVTKGDADRLLGLLRLWSKDNATNTEASSFLNENCTDDQNNADGVGFSLDLPESRERRLLEHRLMLNFHLHMSLPFHHMPSPAWKDLWNHRIPSLALRHDNILYALLAHSATNLLNREPYDAKLFHIRQTYLIGAMREQRRMVQTLTLESADAVCVSSLLLLINAFAMLAERVVEPYEPPVEWLRLGRGSGAVLWLSVGAIIDSGEATKSAMFVVANSQPRFGFDESYFDAVHREHLSSVLSQDLPDSGDDWSDPDTRDAYEKTLSYVGSLHHALRRGEPTYIMSRRIQGFTMVVPPRFIEFVAECRPRALIALAHFFSAVSQIRGVWWLGPVRDAECIAVRELRGIHSILPQSWMGQMIAPMDAAGI